MPWTPNNNIHPSFVCLLLTVLGCANPPSAVVGGDGLGNGSKPGDSAGISGSDEAESPDSGTEGEQPSGSSTLDASESNGTGTGAVGGPPVAMCTDTPPDDLYTCLEQAGWGKCNESWMVGFCDLSCGRCPESNEGTGTDPGVDTDFDASCGVEPVNPNATVQTRNLLCYLYSIYGTRVLSGQQETSWDNPAADIAFYQSTVGAYPAILGGDFLYPDGTTDRAIAYWNAGGIPMIRYHMGAPPLEDSYENSMGSSNLDNVLTVGTAEYTSFIAKLDFAADELLRMQEANVAVLWAPFHEVQPNGWFWWAKGSGQQFIQLWRTMFDYLTTTRGVNNVVWLMPFSGSPNAAFYPGPEYLDLAGPDTYDQGEPFVAMYNTTRSIVGTAIPIPLHETGTIPDPERMFENGAAPWVLFNVWAGYQISNNDVVAIQRTYASEYTVTRDEVPNLR